MSAYTNAIAAYAVNHPVVRYVVKPRDTADDKAYKFAAWMVDTTGQKADQRISSMNDAQKEADRLNLHETREAAARACRHLLG